MGRRSDHSRDALRELMLSAGEDLIAEAGYAHFSAREVAKRVGYSIGTVHNVFGNVDGLLTELNTRTFVAWTQALETALADAGADRIAVLVAAYFRFAREHPRRWAAIYDHRPIGETLPPAVVETRGALLRIVVAEVATALGRAPDAAIGTLARSLVATVHGHCVMALTGSWEAMGQHDAERVALARVRETLAAQR